MGLSARNDGKLLHVKNRHPISKLLANQMPFHYSSVTVTSGAPKRDFAPCITGPT